MEQNNEFVIEFYKENNKIKMIGDFNHNLKNGCISYLHLNELLILGWRDFVLHAEVIDCKIDFLDNLSGIVSVDCDSQKISAKKRQMNNFRA